MDLKEFSQTITAAQSTGSDHTESLAEIIRWVFPESSVMMTPQNGSSVACAVSRFTLLEGTPLALGRGDGSNVVLSGAETSRLHAEIVRVGPIFIIRDLGSRNGVFVNGVRVREAPLPLGSVVRLGEWVGVFVTAARNSTAAAFSEFAPGLFGGPVLRPRVELARRGAASALPIVLKGETGTGKEIFARAIHGWSERTGPFRAVNCAALPDSLAEAELFGYKKGAFTGADQASLGHFRAAAGGTLLLDEIVDMPLALQAKILRVLEHREVLPLGETRPIPVDVHIIAAGTIPSPASSARAQVSQRSPWPLRRSNRTAPSPARAARRDPVAVSANAR
jgi:hypothetical protein